MTRKKLILHDLSASDSQRLLPQENAGCTIFAAAPPVHPCIGCFGCWIKTPGRCVINDRGSDFAALMPAHDEMIVISSMTFGGLSPDVKAVLDRSIGFILPFFQIVNGEMHHSKRYKKSPGLRYILYATDISDQEKQTARKLVAHNALNLGCEHHRVLFCAATDEIKEALK